MDGCPTWLEKLGSEQLGEAWPAERAALAWMPKRYLRVNSLKCTREELQAALAKEQVTTIPVEGVDSALQVTSDAALFRTKAFADGWFEQQDAGSQQVAAALEVSPGMRVIDACAGAGGKTLHLAAMMEGKGRLLAMDVEEWKLENLKQRARRAGAHNVETRVITSSKTVKRLKEVRIACCWTCPAPASACSSAIRMPSGATPPSGCRCWLPCRRRSCSATARW